MDCPEDKRNALLVYAILALGTLAAYGQLLGHDFISLDDGTYVLANPHVRGGFSFGNIAWAFGAGYASNWHPLTWLSHMVDCQFFGVNSGGHHLTNLLLHLANVLLLFTLLRRMTGALWRSAVVAALFAWHPLHVESVAWVAERKDVLSGFFGLLMLLAYTGYVKESEADGPKVRPLYYWTIALFALGLMAKPMLVTLPFVLLLLDFWPLRRFAGFGTFEVDGGVSNRAAQTEQASAPHPTLSPSEGAREKRAAQGLTPVELIREKLPFFALAVVSCVLTFLAQNRGGAVMSMERVPLGLRVGNAFLACAGYLEKTVWPFGLGIYYPLRTSLPAGHVIGAVALVGLISLAVFVIRKRGYALVGWLWFLGMLVPVLGLVQVGNQSMADRYTYLPLIGIFVAVVWGVAELPAVAKLRWGVPKMALAGLAPAACLAVTAVQAGYWKNSETLFRHTVAVTTDNVVALVNLGRALDDEGRTAEAKTQYDLALRVQPDSPLLLNGLGVFYARHNDGAKAFGYYTNALQKDPNYADAHYNFGNLLALEGRWPEAETQFGQAVRLAPDLAEARNNYGTALVQLGKLGDAVDQFKASLRLNPESAQAEYQLGNVWQKLGHIDQAMFSLNEAIRLKPNFPQALVKLGLMQAGMGQIDEAITNFTIATAYAPTNADAFYDLASAYEAKRLLRPAAEMFSMAVRLAPNDADARARLAALDGALGRPDLAVVDYREALRLRPDWPEALRGLAWVLATSSKPESRNGPEAVRLAERASELTKQNPTPQILSSLEVAYAAVGRFDDAIKVAQQVQKLAAAPALKGLADQAAARIELYRAGKAYHD